MKSKTYNIFIDIIINSSYYYYTDIYVLIMKVSGNNILSYAILKGVVLIYNIYNYCNNSL